MEAEKREQIKHQMWSEEPYLVFSQGRLQNLG